MEENRIRYSTSKPVTPRALEMMKFQKIEERKKGLSSRSVKAGKKEERNVKGGWRVKEDESFFYFSRVVDLATKRVGYGERRRIINEKYTKYFKPRRVLKIGVSSMDILKINDLLK